MRIRGTFLKFLHEREGTDYVVWVPPGSGTSSFLTKTVAAGEVASSGFKRLWDDCVSSQRHKRDQNGREIRKEK